MGYMSVWGSAYTPRCSDMRLGLGRAGRARQPVFCCTCSSPVFICLKFPLNDELLVGKNLVLFDIES